MLTKRRLVGCAFLAIAAIAATMTPVFTAYKGHADDRDIEAVLASNPALKGTPSDSCATCHTSGDVKDPAVAGGARHENHCDYCHAVVVRGKRDVKETLNTYGAAYLAAGRDLNAVKAIAAKDSDNDGFTNEVELTRGTNPGDAASNPSVPVAPSRSYPVAALRTIAPVVGRTVFINTTKSRSGDAYNEYRGNAAWDVLQAVGVMETATTVDFLSADGYERTFTIAELKKQWPQAKPVLGLGAPDVPGCGWVSYNARGLDPATPLSPAPILIVFEENGKLLTKAALDAATGRLRGSGPLRLIVPQAEASPPDLPETADPACASKVPRASTFHAEYDHNGGKSSSAVVAVRVKPLPKGTRDIDWQSAALRRLSDEEIVFFGALKPRRP